MGLIDSYTAWRAARDEANARVADLGWRSIVGTQITPDPNQDPNDPVLRYTYTYTFPTPVHYVYNTIKVV